MIDTLRGHPLTAPVAGAAGAAAAWAAVAVLGPQRAVPLPCPLFALTGLACPFCGGTRAVHALAHGEVALAAGYNVVAVVGVPVLVGLWLRWTVRRARGQAAPLLAPSNRTVAVIAAALLVFAVVRNLPFGGWLAP